MVAGLDGLAVGFCDGFCVVCFLTIEDRRKRNVDGGLAGDQVIGCYRKTMTVTF